MHHTAEQHQHQQSPELNRELRITTDTATWLAETLNGGMRTSFEFSSNGEELYGEDGGALREVFDDSIVAAEIIANETPALLFELRRRLIERQELDDIEAMVSGELPNTMVVISDFPPELMRAKNDVGGYNVNRQQTMLRVITLEEDDKIHMITQSLDGSNRQALEAIYAAMGEEPEEGELLSQRTHRQLPADRQTNLMNNLTGKYDDSLSQQYGGSWHAGIRQQNDRQIVDTYEFASSQHDLINWFTNEKLADPVGAEKLRYKLAATTKTRYERYVNGHQITSGYKGESTYQPEAFISVQQIANSQNLMQELNREGRRAASRGETFSGCGGTVKSEEEDSLTESQYSQSGYGNKTKGSLEDRVGKIRKGRCEVKSCPTRPGEVKVGGCGVCIDRCQKLFDRGKDPTKMGVIIKAVGRNTAKGSVKYVSPTAEKPKSQIIQIKQGEKPTINSNNTQNNLMR